MTVACLSAGAALWYGLLILAAVGAGWLIGRRPDANDRARARDRATRVTPTSPMPDDGPGKTSRYGY